jgi:signal transduction histidine kinase/ActR/RegA family two-component response regulator
LTLSQRLDPAARYGAALAAVAAALAGGVALDPLFGVRQPYLTFYLAVTLVAGLFGTGPALLAVAGSLLAATTLLPAWPTDLDTSVWFVASASFVFVSAVTLVMFETSRVARAREAGHALRLGALARASIAIASAPTLRETLGAVTRQARRLVGAHHAVASLDGPVEHEAAIDATDSSPDYPTMRHRDRPWTAFVTVPIVGRDGRTAGVLRLAHPYAGRFTSDDYAILVQLAQQASIALENMRAQNVARASEARYRTVVEAAHAIVWRADASGALVDAPGWTSITDQPVPTGEPLAWLASAHPADRAPTAAVWEAALRERRSARAEFRLRTRAGQYRWVAIHGIPMLDPEGAVREWIGTITDVTTLKRVEAERAEMLRESRRARARAATAARRLHRVQRIVDVMLGDLSVEHLLDKLLPRLVTMVHANSAVILLRDGGALRVRAAVGPDGEALRDALIPADDGFAGAVAEARRPLVWSQAEIRANRPASLRNARTEALLGVPLLVDDRLLGVLQVGSEVGRGFDHDDAELLRLAAARIAVGIELAERRDAERRARAVVESASHAKDELLSMLGHELRNPLSAVRNAIAVARLDGGRRDEALDIARRQSDHLSRMVDDLVDVSRITRGTIRLRRERVNLDDVVRRAVDAVQELLTERRHHLAIHADEPVEVEGDFVRLVQVVTNLLDNAARYTHRDGHIDVSVERRDKRAAISIRDDGAGIPRELAPRVFDVFAQGARPLDRSLGGLGIGLTMVKRIMELHDGTVSMHSDGAGCGTEFTIELAALPAATPARAATTGGRAAWRPQRLLVVEDNVEAAQAFAMLLRHLGHEVEVVHDGPAALSSITNHPPDLAIVDIGLPGMSGYDVARKVRARASGNPPLLVALTGYGTSEDRAQALGAGFDRHLVKPVEIDVLRGMLEGLAQGRATG